MIDTEYFDSCRREEEYEEKSALILVEVSDAHPAHQWKGQPLKRLLERGTSMCRRQQADKK